MPNRQSRSPLHLCALTLNRHNNPVASPDGTVFDAATIRQLVRRTHLNPITGQPLSIHSLVPLVISTDPRTSLPRCPILFHSFNKNIKIVAIATSGNVYSFAAVQRLNLHPRNMTDLIDHTPFTLNDIIVLFDPQHHVWSTDPQHPQSLAIHPPPSNHYRHHHHPIHHSRIVPTPSRALLTHLPNPIPQQHQQDNFPTPQPIHSNHLPIRIYASPPIHPQAYPPTSPAYSSFPASTQENTKRTVLKRLEPSPIPKKPRLQPPVQPAKPQPPDRPTTDNKPSASGYFERKRAEEERKAVYKRIRKGRKGKGYVRVVTNIGHLNIELHCDKVPVTCDNFLSLAETKYYDGLRWHRVIPGFIAQTGDPSGTGEGGDSFWGGCIKDEIRTTLMHDAAGVVSMASSEKDANLSQWFICLDAAPHLDGSHTVFGKVVGGLFVLKKIESEAEMGHPLTVETIEVLVNPIRQIREQMKKSQVPRGMPTADNSATTISSQASSVPSNTPHSPTCDQTRQGALLSFPVGAKHPAVHPPAQTLIPYTIPNRVAQVVKENLPPARTLLSTTELPSKDTGSSLS